MKIYNWIIDETKLKDKSRCTTVYINNNNLNNKLNELTYLGIISTGQGGRNIKTPEPEDKVSKELYTVKQVNVKILR